MTHAPLEWEDGALVASGRAETYPVSNNVPLLLPPGMRADWYRELMEVLLWRYPKELSRMFHFIRFDTAPAEDVCRVYVETLHAILTDKAGLLQAAKVYARSDTLRWIAAGSDTDAAPGDVVSEDAKLHFARYAGQESARKRVDSFLAQRAGSGWAFHLPCYGEWINASKPESVVELATGSGFGSCAVLFEKPAKRCVFSVDVDFACLGNAAGIASLLGESESVLPVDANFWYLPFAENTIDTVCTHFGLDEAREIPRILEETARILRRGGRFICTARIHPFDRQRRILEPFGFMEEEANALFRTARLYAGPENLIKLCEARGLRLLSLKNFERPDSFGRSVLLFEKTSRPI